MISFKNLLFWLRIQQKKDTTFSEFVRDSFQLIDLNQDKLLSDFLRIDHEKRNLFSSRVGLNFVNEFQWNVKNY